MQFKACYSFIRMVCSYLVHHGYVGAAEAFAKSTGQHIEEDWTKIRNRQAIQKLVLEGKMGAAIHLTDQLYPGFLQKHPALHFMLKVRQFIEMVGGHDEATDDADNHTNASGANNDVIDDDMANSNKDEDADVVMNGKETNGNVASSSSEIAESSTAEEANDENSDQPQDMMEIDSDQGGSSNGGPNVTANPDKFQQLIVFGQRVKAMLVDLEQLSGIKNDANNKMLEDAFALLAYPNPWESPVGWQLSPNEREHISAALNSTLLEDAGYPARPPLEVGLSHAKQLVKLMANHDLGACAFANLEDLIKS